jgi:hypothetical protein
LRRGQEGEVLDPHAARVRGGGDVALAVGQEDVREPGRGVHDASEEIRGRCTLRALHGRPLPEQEEDALRIGHHTSMFGGEQLDQAAGFVALPDAGASAFLEPLIEDEDEKRARRQRDEQEQPQADPAQTSLRPTRRIVRDSPSGV